MWDSAPGRRSALPVCFIVLLAGTDRAGAQEVVEEVVVTAQKRLQNAQDVGISIAVLDASQMQSVNITNPTGIADRVPAMRVDSPGPVNATYNLRGVATRDVSPHNEGAVAFFNDGVYVAVGQATTAPIFDLERVEVLKGPQGTLFGRNATGGLVQTVSRKPSQKFDAYAQASAGAFDQYGFEGAVGGALTETLSGRLSLFSNRRDGFITNPIGPDSEALESYAGRAQLLYEPSENFDALLSVRYSTYQPSAARGYDTRPLIIDATGATRPPASQAEYAAFCAGLFAPVGGVPPGLTVAPPGAIQRGNCFFAQPSMDTWTAASNFSRYANHYAATSATLNWYLSDTVSVTSVSDYQSFTSDFMSDVDGSPLQLFNFGISTDTSQFSQELRVNGDAGSTRWIAGLYYLNIDGSFSSTFDVSGNPAFLTIRQVAPYALDTRSFAGFAHVEYDFTPQWSVIVGGRWTEDKKELDQSPSQCSDPLGGFLCGLYGNVLFPTTIAFAGFNGEIDKGDWAGKAELNWKPATGQLIYAGVNRGNKVGSFNAGAGQFLTPDLVPYKNEVITSYEAGIKSTLPDGRTTLNGSVFYYDYRDYQTYAVVNGTLRVFNNDARVKGAEIELVSRPFEHLTLQLSGSYVDGVQIDLPAAAGPRDTVMPGAPKWTAFAMGRYSWPTAQGAFDAMLDGSYVSERSSDAVDPPALRLPSYVRANVSLGYSSADDRWSARVWCRNLTDRAVENFTSNLAVITGGEEVIWEEPRTYGVIFTYRWQ